MHLFGYCFKTDQVEISPAPDMSFLSQVFSVLFSHFRDALAPPHSLGFVSKPVAQWLKVQNLKPGEMCTFELLLMLGLLFLVPFPSFISNL